MTTSYDLLRVARASERELAREVRGSMQAIGMPTTSDTRVDLAAALRPTIDRLRATDYQASLGKMASDAVQYGIRVAPVELRTYPLGAAVDAILRATESRRVAEGMIDINALDEESISAAQTTRLVRVSETAPEVSDLVAQKITASLARHVRAAGRALVSDTVERGDALDLTGRRVRVGVARVLTGSENCPFCMMLASRGAVYSEDTALYRVDGRRYHDNCDCIAQLVSEGQTWEGEAEQRRLERAWADVSDAGNGNNANRQMAAWTRAVRDGTITARGFSPL